MPDKKKCRHATPGPRAETFAQEDVGASGRGPRRAEFRRDHAVRNRDDRADDPGQIGLRSRQGLQNQGDCDERADPDHVRHVDGRGVQKPQSSLQFGHVASNVSMQVAASGESHAGGVTRPGTDAISRGRSRNFGIFVRRRRSPESSPAAPPTLLPPRTARAYHDRRLFFDRRAYQYGACAQRGRF